MDRQMIRSFFDQIAPAWDTHRPPDAGRIGRILDVADIVPNVTVLDVACGTGVLFPYYIERGVSHITGVDLSANMLAQAEKKCSDPRVTLLCGDAETLPLGPHDRCVMFNAFPHFPEPAAILTALSAALKIGGRLTIAHGEGRAAINARHGGSAQSVSRELMPAGELAGLFPAALCVDAVLDTDEVYLVSGVRRA